jgi:D-alanine transaminase
MACPQRRGEEMLLLVDEVWITSSSLEGTPVITLDGKAVGKGVPLPIWEVVTGLFEQYRQAFVADGKKMHTKPCIKV